MRSRLAKEIRPLLWPFLFMAAAMALPPWLPMARSTQWSFPVFAWLLGAALLSICAFAFEHQERTLGLLLAQPISRARIWWEKYRVLVPLILVPIVVLSLAWPPRYGMFDFAAFGVVATSVAASLASAPFWSGVALSVIGGFAFSVAAQLVVFVACLYLVTMAPVFPNLPTAIRVVGSLYALGMLALSWRFFGRGGRRIATITQEEVESRTALQGALGFLTPRCRPRERWLNVVRRELCLERSTIQLAAIALLVTAGVLAVDLSLPGPSLRLTLDFLLLYPTFVTSVGVALLAGSTALCEEKSLGTAKWSQVLPVATRTQYFLKAAMAAAMFGLIGIGGVFAVAYFYQQLVPQAFQSFGYVRFSGYYLAGTLLPFVLSLHLSVLARSTLQAVLMTIATTAGTAFVFVLGAVPLWRLEGRAMERGTVLWRLATSETPVGPLPAVLTALVISAALVRLLWSAAGAFGQASAPRKIVRSILWCIVLTAGTGLVGTYFDLAYSTAIVAQIDTFDSIRARLEPAVRQLDKSNPARVLGTKITLSSDQFRAAAGSAAVSAGWFTDPQQQFVLEAIRLPGPTGPLNRRTSFASQHRQVRLTFLPPLELQENPDPRLRFVRFLDYWVDP